MGTILIVSKASLVLEWLREERKQARLWRHDLLVISELLGGGSSSGSGGGGGGVCIG